MSSAPKAVLVRTSTANLGAKTISEEIRIYVADLAAYNNGKLHGVWIDATQDLDAIQDQINAMLADSLKASRKITPFTTMKALAGIQ